MGVPSRLARSVAMPRPRRAGWGCRPGSPARWRCLTPACRVGCRPPARPIGSGAGHARPDRTAGALPRHGAEGARAASARPGGGLSAWLSPVRAVGLAQPGEGAAPAQGGGCGPRRLGPAGACRFGQVEQGTYRAGPVRRGSFGSAPAWRGLSAWRSAAAVCRPGPARWEARRSGPVRRGRCPSPVRRVRTASARPGGGPSIWPGPAGACRRGSVGLAQSGMSLTAWRSAAAVCRAGPSPAGARRAGPGDCGLWLSSVGPCPVWPVLRGPCRSGSARRGPVGLSQSGRARRPGPARQGAHRPRGPVGLVRLGQGGPGGAADASGLGSSALRSGRAAEALPRVAPRWRASGIRGTLSCAAPSSPVFSAVGRVSGGVPPGSLPRSPSRRNTFASHSFTLRNTARTASRFRVQMLFASNR